MSKLYMLIMKENRLLKVGFTRNLNKRIKDYQTTNPIAEFIGIVNGTIQDEREYHDELEELGFTRIEGTEFFEIPKNISTRQIMKKGFLIFS
jgi:hypothetical protein